MTRGRIGLAFGVAYAVLSIVMLVVYGIGALLLLVVVLIVGAAHEEALHRHARRNLR